MIRRKSGHYPLLGIEKNSLAANQNQYTTEEYCWQGPFKANEQVKVAPSGGYQVSGKWSRGKSLL